MAHAAQHQATAPTSPARTAMKWVKINKYCELSGDTRTPSMPKIAGRSGPKAFTIRRRLTVAFGSTSRKSTNGSSRIRAKAAARRPSGN